MLLCFPMLTLRNPELKLYLRRSMLFLSLCLLLGGAIFYLSPNRFSHAQTSFRRIAYLPVHSRCESALLSISQCGPQGAECVARIFRSLANDVDPSKFTTSTWENCMAEGLRRWAQTFVTQANQSPVYPGPGTMPAPTVPAPSTHPTTTQILPAPFPIVTQPVVLYGPRAYFSLDRCDGIPVYIDRGSGAQGLPSQSRRTPARSTCQLQINAGFNANNPGQRRVLPNGCLRGTCQYLGESSVLETALPPIGN